MENLVANAFIAGEPASGKTTLIKKLVNDLFQRSNVQIFAINTHGEISHDNKENLYMHRVNPYVMYTNDTLVSECKDSILVNKRDLLKDIHKLVAKKAFTPKQMSMLSMIITSLYSEKEVDLKYFKEKNAFSDEDIKELHAVAETISKMSIICDGNKYFENYNDNNKYVPYCYSVGESNIESKIKELCLFDYIYERMAINCANKKESYLFIDDVLEFINEDENTFDAILMLAKRCRMLNGHIIMTDSFDSKKMQLSRNSTYLYRLVGACTDIICLKTNDNICNTLSSCMNYDGKLLEKTKKLNIGETIRLH